MFRTAGQIWLAAHHAGFAIPGGTVGLLPLGLMILPAVLLYRAGRWMARDADLRLRLPARLPKNSPGEQANARRRAQLVLVVQAGVSLAAPYAMLAGRHRARRPQRGHAAVHRRGADQPLRAGVPRRLAGHRAHDRPVAGDAAPAARAAALADRRHGRRHHVLLVAGLALVLMARSVNFGQIRELTDVLAPGFVGGLLLLLVEALYLLNTVIWAPPTSPGRGSPIGAGTLVAPTGVNWARCRACRCSARCPRAVPCRAGRWR